MKEYLKPEVEVVEFATNIIMEGESDGDIISGGGVNDD